MSNYNDLAFTPTTAYADRTAYETRPASEDRVRAIFNALPLEIQTFINTEIIAKLNAEYDLLRGTGGAAVLGLEALAPGAPTKLQTALAALRAEMLAIVLGDIPDASITEAKLVSAVIAKLATAEEKAIWNNPPQPLLVNLFDITTSADSARIDINMSAIDATQYSEFEIQAELHTASGTESGLYASLYLNNDTDAHYLYNTNSFSQGYMTGNNYPHAINKWNLIFAPSGMISVKWTGCQASYSSMLNKQLAVTGAADPSIINVGNLTSINIVSTYGNILSGSKIIVNGVKK